MGDVGKPEFSFGELLVLLDVEGVGAMASSLPTAAEAEALAPGSMRGTPPCVEFHGALRFRTGLAHLYEAPRTDLVVSPGHVLLAITRFPDVDIFTNMFEWVTSYLGDALAPTARDGGREGFHEYAGQGVVATVRYTRPNVRLDSREMRLEVGLRRDEPAVATLRRLLGIAADVPVAPKDDGNWHEQPTSWAVHLECARLGATARFRFSAPHHDGQISTANLCEEWCWRWLDLCAGSGLGLPDRFQLAWDLGPLGHASIIRGDGAHRRDVHELHVPSAWLAG